MYIDMDFKLHNLYDFLFDIQPILVLHSIPCFSFKALYVSLMENGNHPLSEKIVGVK